MIVKSKLEYSGLFATLLFLILHPAFLLAQGKNAFIRRGDALGITDCSQATISQVPGFNWVVYGSGAAWYRQMIDLSQPFELSFIIDFTDTLATDGMAFVLQPDSNAIGGKGNGMGYLGIKNSIGITFDLRVDKVDNDPPFSHASIHINGNITHGTPDELAGPIDLNPYYAPVKWFYKYTTIRWEPATQTLAAYIDGNLFISAQYDIVNKLFNGQTKVYWGLAGSVTQLKSYEDVPIDARPILGYFSAYFGTIAPKYYTKPTLDTCFGAPIQFFDTSLYLSDAIFGSRNYARYFWDFGDGTTSTAKDPPPHNYPKAGEYKVKYTVTNQIGCTVDTLVTDIALGVVPKADFKNDIVCNDRSALFKDASSVDVGEINSWRWEVNNVFASKDTNLLANFAQPTTVPIKLTVSTYYGCSADTTKLITVNLAPKVDYQFNKNCDGEVSFTSALLNAVNIKKWNWEFGDGNFSSEPSPTHLYKKNDDYSATLTALAENGCSSDTVIEKIKINKVYAFAGNDTLVAPNQPLQLQATGGDSYKWFPPNNLSDANISNPIARLARDQQYIVSVQNIDGCEGRDTINIRVINGPAMYVPTAFTPNGDGKNDVLRIIIPGLKQLYYFKIFDRWGNEVFATSDPLKGWDGRIRGIDQASAVYTWIASFVDYRDVKLNGKGIVTLIR